MKKLKWIILLGLALATNNASAQNRIEVVVTEVRDTTGTIRVGLFSDEATFLKKAIVGKTVKASAGRTIAVFENVPSGTYAVSVIHDSNRNGELDSNLFGIPKEGFGFSNDAMGTFGPPSFEKAKFVISGSVIVSVKTRYM